MVNMGPGAMTPDSDMTITVPNAASIIFPFLTRENYIYIIAFTSDFYPVSSLLTACKINLEGTVILEDSRFYREDEGYQGGGYNQLML
jgi:hypothetical protein